jgi:hypothetical protein
MNSPHVYDKAKYHLNSIEEYGLSQEHASNHTVVFLRWLIENEMMSDFFEEESGVLMQNYRANEATIHAVYEWWDCSLADEMLSEEGNSFALHYFDFDKGIYIHDYIATLQRNLPTEYHIDYSEENFQKIKQVIDRRYSEWKKPKKKWWQFKSH